MKEVGKDLYPELFGLCEQYSVANYVEGIVELCTDTAAKIDPDGVASHSVGHRCVSLQLWCPNNGEPLCT